MEETPGEYSRHHRFQTQAASIFRQRSREQGIATFTDKDDPCLQIGKTVLSLQKPRQDQELDSFNVNLKAEVACKTATAIKA